MYFEWVLMKNLLLHLVNLYGGLKMKKVKKTEASTSAINDELNYTLWSHILLSLFIFICSFCHSTAKQRKLIKEESKYTIGPDERKK